MSLPIPGKLGIQIIFNSQEINNSISQIISTMEKIPEIKTRTEILVQTDNETAAMFSDRINDHIESLEDTHNIFIQPIIVQFTTDPNGRQTANIVYSFYGNMSKIDGSINRILSSYRSCLRSLYYAQSNNNTDGDKMYSYKAAGFEKALQELGITKERLEAIQKEEIDDYEKNYGSS